MMIQRDPLGNLTVEDPALDLDRLAQWPPLDNFYRRGGFCQPHLVIIKDLDIPGVPPAGPVLECLELVADGVRGQYLATMAFIEDPGDIALIVEIHAQVIILQKGGGGWPGDGTLLWLLRCRLQCDRAIRLNLSGIYPQPGGRWLRGQHAPISPEPPVNITRHKDKPGLGERRRVNEQQVPSQFVAQNLQ